VIVERDQYNFLIMKNDELISHLGTIGRNRKDDLRSFGMATEELCQRYGTVSKIVFAKTTTSDNTSLLQCIMYIGQ